MNNEKKHQNSVEDLILKAADSSEMYSTSTQVEVDKIFFQVAQMAACSRIELAKMAVEETGMGVVEDKVIKNHFSSEYVYHKYKDLKTCGIVERNDALGFHKVASPMGIIAGIIPCTNPTSTTIFKALLAIKTRNAIIISSHPRSSKCVAKTVELLQSAVSKAGGPDNLISCIAEPTIEKTKFLITHPKISVILATGGPSLVHASYSSGNPAIGVGAGNTPTIIDETADIDMAVNSIVLSKTFDNGVVCASEQSVIAIEDIYAKLKQVLKENGGHILTEKQYKKVSDIIIFNKRINPEIVGQSALKIAKMAGISVSKGTKLLIAEVSSIGKDEPFSYEKLSPLLALYKSKDFYEAVKVADQLLSFTGAGHTSILHTNESNYDRIEYFGEHMKTTRILINIPGSQGAIGDIYNFHLEPSLTLGCGSYGKNSISGNICPRHLLNFKTVAERRENMLWFRVPPKIFFKYGCLTEALRSIQSFKRAFIVSDRTLFELGVLEQIEGSLKQMNIHYETFLDVPTNPTLSVVKNGLERLNLFNPDVIIAVGGGSPMDAAKIMWIMHDHPDIEFSNLASRFMDIRKRISSIAENGKKTLFVAIPTTSGTGSEISPFSVITDDTNDGVKYPIADYAITPDIAIIDPVFVMSLPKSLISASGIDAITHAIESMVSVMSTVFTRSIAKEALVLLFNYLSESYHGAKNNKEAREHVHYAATLAGMAFSNTSLGLVHSMAHVLGETFHIAHGVACGLCLPHVIEYNATKTPTKLVGFPQYKTPIAINRYVEIVDTLGLKADSDEEKIEVLINTIKALKKDLHLPATLKEMGIEEKDFMVKIDFLSERAFDDQCTPTNPRYPLISEIRTLFMKVHQA